ncbi:hypothetical protein JL720_2468 [Aureococcus anophagefferens]|nr:hypothetical protein JL720_2468 [Aureococcus anophagefferens]
MSSTRSRLAAAAAAVGVGALLYARARRRRSSAAEALEPKTTAEVARRVELSVLRLCRVAHRGARDHGGEVVLVTNNNFALAPTIFRNVSSPSRAAFAKIPRAPDYAPPLLQFMNEDCDFAMEHADGSFMDHLQFCFEYSARTSRRVAERAAAPLRARRGHELLPCDASKIPKLKALLTAREFTQVHLLDFLPAADWRAEIDKDLFLMNFAALHALLVAKGKLAAIGRKEIAKYSAIGHDLAFAPPLARLPR